MRHKKWFLRVAFEQTHTGHVWVCVSLCVQAVCLQLLSQPSKTQAAMWTIRPVGRLLNQGVKQTLSPAFHKMFLVLIQACGVNSINI